MKKKKLNPKKMFFVSLSTACLTFAFPTPAYAIEDINTQVEQSMKSLQINMDSAKKLHIHSELSNNKEYHNIYDTEGHIIFLYRNMYSTSCTSYEYTNFNKLKQCIHCTDGTYFVYETYYYNENQQINRYIKAQQKNGLTTPPTLFIYDYYYDDSGKFTHSTYTSPNGTIKPNLIFTYDDSGNVIVKQEYNTEGKLQTIEILDYDTSGNLITKTRNFLLSSNYTYYAYTYDDENRLSSSLYLDNNSLDERIYNSSGKLTTVNKYYDGVLNNTTNYTYNTNGKLSCIENNLIGTTNYTYDSDMNLITLSTPDYIYECAYDQDGDLTNIFKFYLYPDDTIDRNEYEQYVYYEE